MQTLGVREISYADEKYSSVISAPFVLNILNITIGSFVIAKKSPKYNRLLLLFYYLPVALVCFIVFIVYSFAILPFAYIKIVAHKFAIMVVTPK